MKCPGCGSLEDRVIDSRTGGDGNSIRRRRVCQQCNRRFTTYERIEAHRPLVIKKNDTREPFNRDKILAGLRKACQKRPVEEGRLEQAVERVEQILQERGDAEVDARVIGAMLVEDLKDIDPVAYVRFASVYQEFEDISEFTRILPVDSDPKSVDSNPKTGRASGESDSDSSRRGEL